MTLYIIALSLPKHNQSLGETSARAELHRKTFEHSSNLKVVKQQTRANGG